MPQTAAAAASAAAGGAAAATPSATQLNRRVLFECEEGRVVTLQELLDKRPSFLHTQEDKALFEQVWVCH